MVTLHFSSIDEVYIHDQRDQWKDILKRSESGTLVTKVAITYSEGVTFYEFDVIFDIVEAGDCPSYMMIDGKKR